MDSIPEPSTLALKIDFDRESVGDIDPIYFNYAEVRATNEETTIVLCQRKDFNFEVVANEVHVPARAVAVIITSTAHAKRLAEAIALQVQAFESKEKER